MNSMVKKEKENDRGLDVYKKMEEKDQQIVELKQELKTSIQQLTHDLDTKLQQQTHDLNTKLQQQTQLVISQFTCHSHTLTEFTKLQAEGVGGSWWSEYFYNYLGGYRFRLNIGMDMGQPGAHTSQHILVWTQVTMINSCTGH